MADTASEFKQVKGVFLFEGFQHWLNVVYDLNEHKIAHDSNTSHAFSESYNASLQVALFDPLILDATLQASLLLNQEKSRNGSSFKSNFSTWQPFVKPLPPVDTFQYNFSGNGLSKSRIPFTLLSYSTRNTVQNTFTTPSTNDNAGNEFSITFLNSTLQSRFHFARTTTTTTNGDATNKSLSNSYSYSAEHNYGDFSATTLNASFSDQSGTTTGGTAMSSSANSLGLSNSLTLGTIQRYTLLSSIQLSNTIVDALPTRALYFTENFGATLGRALSADASYTFTNTRSSQLTGPTREKLDIREITRNVGDIGIKHQLFDSLGTELRGSAAFSRESDGKENSYAVNAIASYTKKLPQGSSLSLGFNKGYNLVDRQVSSSTTYVSDELSKIIHQGDTIDLTVGDGTLRSVTSVKSEDRLTTYTEGVDYTVNYALGRIFILSGGGVTIDMAGTGSRLYLSYTIFKDPQLTYSTDSVSVTSNLMLFDNLVSLGASWSDIKRTLIHGPEDNGLKGSQTMTFFVGSNYNTTTTRFSYRKATTGDFRTQTLEGSGSTSFSTGRALISIGLQNSYNMYGATLTASGYRENLANATLSYSRDILQTLKLVIDGNVNDVRSEIKPAKDSLSLRAKVQSAWNMFTINLTGQTVWIFETSSTSRNDSLHIDFSRYF
ncbi:MAG TPA: hypothetical protein HPP94_15870 [Desulfuromonadales bacterium]|nr:hypothetical protein [Desulfuromonadales bacterium]